MKKLIIAGIVLASVICASIVLMSFKPGPAEESVVLVRTFESVNSMYASKIIVSDGTQILKITELEVMRPKTQESNVLKIASALKELKNSGYTLVTSSSGGSDAFTITDYVFEKR
jgi:hypothetical protein